MSRDNQRGSPEPWSSKIWFRGLFISRAITFLFLFFFFFSRTVLISSSFIMRTANQCLRLLMLSSYLTTMTTTKKNLRVLYDHFLLWCEMTNPYTSLMKRPCVTSSTGSRACDDQSSCLCSPCLTRVSCNIDSIISFKPLFVVKELHRYWRGPFINECRKCLHPIWSLCRQTNRFLSAI